MTVDLKKLCGSYWKTDHLSGAESQLNCNVKYGGSLPHSRSCLFCLKQGSLRAGCDSVSSSIMNMSPSARGLGSGWVSIIGTSVFQSWRLLRMAEEPRRKVAEKRGGRLQWSLKVLLSVRWHLRAWPTGTTCHSSTCYYPYKSDRGPGSRWQIRAATSWQQPPGETHPRGSKKPSNEKILDFCGCVTWCPLKSCHVLKKRFLNRPCYLVIIL